MSQMTQQTSSISPGKSGGNAGSPGPWAAIKEGKSIGSHMGSTVIRGFFLRGFARWLRAFRKVSDGDYFWKQHIGMQGLKDVQWISYLRIDLEYIVLVFGGDS